MTTKTYEWDAEFQNKILGCLFKDVAFNERTQDLIKPDYFDSQADGCLAALGIDFYGKYSRVPDKVTLAKLLKEAIASKRIREDLVEDVKNSVKQLYAADVTDAAYVADEVSHFAKQRAIENAILKSAELIASGKVDDVEKTMARAFEIGQAELLSFYNYAEKIADRSRIREEERTGRSAPKGIGTGLAAFDGVLKHRGWGRKELTLFLGPPKSGKSAHLSFFAKNAAMLGHTALIVTLEVSTEITADRVDAAISEVPLTDFGGRIGDIDRSVMEAMARSGGALYIEEFPSGSLSPKALKRVLQRYKSRGITFDLVAVDYMDIMCPDRWVDNPIENSKSIGIGLRAIAQIENVAMLSATQTNREGAKAKIVEMEHTAEDFNRVRTADLLISINTSEDERARGESRLFFAASRNQEGFFSLRVQRDLSTMRAVTKVLGRE